MTAKFVIAGGLLAAAVLTTTPSIAAEAPKAAAKPDACAPAGALKFICGIKRPEDLVLIPGTKWVIASGLGEGNSLKLVDSQTKAVRQWYPAKDAEPAKPDLKAYPGCPAEPNAARLVAHGLSLRPGAGGHLTLYMVNHNGREAIEVFDVTPGAAPSIRWVGCVIMPKDEPANSVAAAPDGTLLATVLNLPKTTRADIHAGRPTGAVIEWSMKTKAWRTIPNTNLSGNNGIDTSPDGKTFYVVALGSQRVLAFDRTDEKKKPRVAQLSGFWPDNVRLDARGRLLTAGGSNPCTDKQGMELPATTPCPHNYVVVAVDPKTMASTVLAKGPLIPAFSGPTIAVPVGRELWIGTHESDRIAYVSAP